MERHDMRELAKKNKSKEETEQEKPSFLKKVSGLRDKLKLGPHHKMERFTVMVGTAAAMLFLVTVLSFFANRSEMTSIASTQAMYTEDFTFSLSNQKMNVEGVYGNKDRTDVMVLLRMDDPTAMSTDAKNYELFITGEKDSISYAPNVSFSLFGSTGYGMVRFQDDEPLQKEILDVTIRSNADLSSDEGSGASPDEDNEDASFSEYDQGKFYVNPGADGVTTFDWLKAGEDDPTVLYTALVADAADKEIHAEIDENVTELGKLLNRSTEYENRLVSAGYEAPELPWFMKGDYVDEDNNLVPATNLAGAYDFDYSTKTIRDGYISQVMDGMSGYDDYMKKQEEAKENGEEDDSRKEEVARIEKLRANDGSELDLNTVSTGTSPSAQVAAKDSASALDSTWRSYLATKTKVQRDLARELLVLDADVQSQKESYSVQKDKDAVTLY